MNLKVFSLEEEEWREYDFAGRVYRIVYPVLLVYREGGTTHRVVDKSGRVHCVPAPGYHGCVLRWYSREGYPPVGF